MYNNSFPYVIRKIKTLDILKPYMNAELREQPKEEERLEKKFKRHPITHRYQYRNIRTRVAKLTSRAKIKYFSDKIFEMNSRAKINLEKN